jgi:hypothetical protein
MYTVQYSRRMANRGRNPECVEGIICSVHSRHKHLSKWRAEKEKMFEDLCVARRACKISPLGRLWGLLNLKERSEGQNWKSRAVSHRKESPKVVISCRRLKLVFSGQRTVSET